MVTCRSVAKACSMQNVYGNNSNICINFIGKKVKQTPAAFIFLYFNTDAVVLHRTIHSMRKVCDNNSHVYIYALNYYIDLLWRNINLSGKTVKQTPLVLISWSGGYLQVSSKETLYVRSLGQQQQCSYLSVEFCKKSVSTTIAARSINLSGKTVKQTPAARIFWYFNIDAVVLHRTIHSRRKIWKPCL